MQTQKTETKATKATETKEETLTLAKAESLAASLASEYTIADVTIAAQSFRRATLGRALKARFAPVKAS